MDSNTERPSNPNLNLSLQQIRYDQENPTNMYTTEDDLLKPTSTSKSCNAAVEESETILTRSAKLPPYRSLIVANNSTMSLPQVRVKEVPDLDNVQPFLSDPVLSDDLGNSKSQGGRKEGALTPLARPMPYFSSSKPSITEMILNDKVKRALATSWVFDPRACSITAAQRHVAAPYHGLTKEEYNWLKGNKFSLAADAIKEKQDESDLAKQYLDWDKHWITSEPYPDINEINVDQELDTFYGTGENSDFGTTEQLATNHDQQLGTFNETGKDVNFGTTEQMAINHDQQLGAFFETGEDVYFGMTEQVTINHDHLEPDNDQLEPTHDQMAPNHELFDRESMSTTWLTLPQDYRMLAGPLTSNSFHDSGVHMEDHFAEEANKESPPQSACMMPMEQIIHRNDTALSKPLEGTVEDSLAQYEYSFASSVSDYSERECSSSVSDDVEINEDECSVPHLEAASPLGLPINREKLSTSQHSITHGQDMNNVLDGYLHGPTHNLSLPMESSLLNGGAGPGYEAEAGHSTIISEEDFSQSSIYNQHELSIPNYPSKSSTQQLGDLQAHAGAFSFENTTGLQPHAGMDLLNASMELPVYASVSTLDNPANVQAHAGASLFNYPSKNAFQQHGDQKLLYPAQANIVRQEGYQNLTPEYDSDKDNNLDHPGPASPATLPEFTENTNNHAISEDPSNPYDYRHYLPTDFRQPSGGMNFDFLALPQPQASNTNQVNHAKGNQITFNNAQNRETNPMLLQPSFHAGVPITNPMPSSPTTLPPSSPPALHSYPEITPTAILRSNAPSSPAQFAPSTPTPVMMPNTDLVTPCSALKDEAPVTHAGTWRKEEHVQPEEAASANEAPKIPVKDVFGVQQKRRVGRPVGSKTNKKIADNGATKGTPISGGQAPKKRLRKTTGDAGSELKKVRGTKKDTTKAAPESSDSTLTAAKPETTEEAAKVKATKHKQSPISASEGQPKTKRVRMPSRKSLEKKAAEEK